MELSARMGDSQNEEAMGEFSPKGKILLNPELIKAPTGCIDYVIMHELCHLKHSLHDKRFFNLLATVLPDWQRNRPWKNKKFKQVRERKNHEI